jgi:mRNA interferase RelE/StbE
MLYAVVFRSSAAKELRKLPAPARKQVSEAIDSLAADSRPQGVRKMAGADAWRIRIGDYRVVYSIADQQLMIEIIKIGNRRDVYR